MNMNQEMLEILIGKYLDGEITPSEQQILETQLNKDPQSEMLLRQFQDLHERSSEVVTSELLGQGKTPEEIFELAYKRQSKNPFSKIAAHRGYIRFVTGVAAGLILGLALHFVLPAASTIPNESTTQIAAAPNTNNQADLQMRRLPQYPDKFRRKCHSKRGLVQFHRQKWKSVAYRGTQGKCSTAGGI